MKILIRMPNWIGDIVMASCVLYDIRAAFPTATIAVMVKAPFGGLLQSIHGIDEIIEFQKTPLRSVQNHKAICRRIRFGEFDIGILLTNSISSALYFYFGGVKRRIGTGGFRQFLLTDAPYIEPRIHQINAYKSLLKPLGIPISKTKPMLHIEKEVVEAVAQKIKGQFSTQPKFWIGINPGAAYGLAKCWPFDYFQTLIQHLLSMEDVGVVITGAAADAQKYNALCTNDRIVNYAGKTNIRELMGLIGMCNLFVSNDSGPMHIADALDIPTIALFGSTDPKKTGPARGGIVLYANASCSPCFKRKCPIDFRCMRSITPNQVFGKIKEILESQCVLQQQ